MRLASVVAVIKGFVCLPLGRRISFDGLKSVKTAAEKTDAGTAGNRGGAGLYPYSGKHRPPVGVEFSVQSRTDYIFVRNGRPDLPWLNRFGKVRGTKSRGGDNFPRFMPLRPKIYFSGAGVLGFSALGPGRRFFKCYVIYNIVDYHAFKRDHGRDQGRVRPGP
jgi:hypothetical protein